jgi:hypothetical protein
VELLALARAASQETIDRLHRHDLSWTFEGHEEASWSGPRGAILAIVRNLVDNVAEPPQPERQPHHAPR